MDERKRELEPCPMKNANLLNKAVWWWAGDIFRKGARKNLDLDDLYEVMDDDRTAHVCEKLEHNWDKELELRKSGQQPSYARAMIKTFHWTHASYAIWAVLEEVLYVTQPILLGGLLRYFRANSNMEPWEAYMYALGVGLCAFGLTLVHHPYFFCGNRLGMWLRVSSCSLMFKKVLRLSNRALGQTSTGHIINLMTNDVVRFDLCTLFIHFLWIGPVQAVAVMAILWVKLGPSSLAGFTLLILLIPMQAFFSRLFSKLRRKTAIFTDERVAIMNEILAGVRIIKMYCWEKPFAELIKKVRKQESKRVYGSNYCRAVATAPFFSSAKLIAFLTFLSFILDGRSLTTEIVFVSIALYNPVRVVMTLYWAWGVQLLSEARVSCQRIQEFLLLEEKSEASPGIVPSEERPAPSDCKVSAMSISASWDPASNQKTLHNLSFEVGHGELLMVVGPVAAGKSSLLMTLLGELPLTDGKVKVNGKVAYISQQPWVFSASIRQNILFGAEYDEARYKRAIKAATLKRDLEILENGDQTLVGDRGVSLSGGQKARVSLARALYFDADVYLLDDPLSAVDTSVGRHIMEKCICGLLKSKPRILVTHQVQYLPKADKILILKGGEVMNIGTYGELKAQGIDFVSLMKPPEEAAEAVSSTDDLTMLPLGMEIDTAAIIGSHDSATRFLGTPRDRSYLSEEKEGRERLLMDEDDHLPPKKPPRVLDSSFANSVEAISNLPYGSTMTLDTIGSDIKPDFVAPVQDEALFKGTLSWRLYYDYWRSGMGLFGLFVCLILNLSAHAAAIACDWWLAIWARQSEAHYHALYQHQMLLDQGHNITNVTIPPLDNHRNLYIFAAITASCFILGFLRSLDVFHILVSASKNVHNQMFASIIRAPVLFFDTNPLGRILNRFSKDIGLLDDQLPLTTYDLVQCVLLVLGVILVACVVNPWIFIAVAPLIVVFIFMRRYYLMTSRDVKRVEAAARSPVYSHLTATVHGLHTVRAYQVQDIFTQEFYKHQDLHTSSWFLFLSTGRWFGFRLDLLCACFITAVSLCSVAAASSLDGGLVGLSVSSALTLMGFFQWAIRQSAEVENLMTSVERVKEYINLEPEAALECAPDKQPPADWPQKGCIEAKGVNLKYSKDGATVLKNLNFSVQMREKVGIVGRTGAGKSSLITMLFRLSEPEGHLIIDGIETSEIGLHDLRKKISMIPQDPILFNGTVRRNLDPFAQHSDELLWQALGEVELQASVKDLAEGLDYKISEGGINFSVGQRQLLCLARAILKRNRILVIDEATANVDPRTDSLIQETIREKFRDCTVLTIAHRLHTIVDSERVMVMDQGEIIEFDEPANLLQDESSRFYKMAAETGPEELKRLVEAAKSAQVKNQQIRQSYENEPDSPSNESAPVNDATHEKDPSV